MLPLCPKLVGTMAKCDVVEIPLIDLNRCSWGTVPMSNELGMWLANLNKVSVPTAIRWQPISIVAQPSSCTLLSISLYTLTNSNALDLISGIRCVLLSSCRVGAGYHCKTLDFRSPSGSVGLLLDVVEVIVGGINESFFTPISTTMPSRSMKSSGDS